MQEHLEDPAGPAERSMESLLAAPEHPVAAFLRQEDGNVILEYVTLLMGVFLSVSLTVAPLQNALMSFAETVFEHLHYV